MQYDSATNRRLRCPSHAQTTLAEGAVHSLMTTTNHQSNQQQKNKYRVVLGLGPGRSGTKSLTELLASQINVVHAEHEMIVPRVYRRLPNGHIDITALESEGKEKDAATNTIEGEMTTTNSSTSSKKNKGSWGADRRLEWDVPRLARGAPQRTEEEEALWRVMRLLEQREAFIGWVRDASTTEKDTTGSMAAKPKKLGARGWREHNNYIMSNSNGKCDTSASDDSAATDKADNNIPIVAAVSSVALAYVHEYIALDPTIRIVVLMRPREEVASSFLKKSKGRNHWQQHQHRQRCSPCSTSEYVQPDKTWDSAFPNMSDEECRQFMVDDDSEVKDATERPDKACAIRAYWELYNDVACELCSERYPDNIQVFDMNTALNDVAVQEKLLKWCGFDEPVLDAAVHLNKKKLK